VEKIVNATDQKEVPLTAEDRSTPMRIQLAPGKYFVTVSGPSGTQKTVELTITAGKPTSQKIEMGTVNLDELEKEVAKP
jgi:ABC-type taurine transport system ATPase subunit